MRIKQIPVKSSSVEALGYDPRQRLLRVWFKGGKVFDYYNVPVKLFKRFFTVDSITGYINKFIKNKFSFRERHPANIDAFAPRNVIGKKKIV